MNEVSQAFAVNLNSTYFCLRDVAAKKEITWSDRGEGHKRINFGGSSVWTDYKTEYEAWEAAIAHFPNLLDELGKQESVAQRGFALRAEMLLGMGVARFQELKESFDEEIMRIYETAMSALDATKATKARPKVTRVRRTTAVSWLEVRTRIHAPYFPEKVLCGIRCLPSALEDKTWSVRVRVPAMTNAAMMEVQRRIEELHAQLGYRGITVKDVQNGTTLDL
jgi:hypothetical protein